MAGIGFSLHRLLQADRLSSNVRGLLHATVIAAGPWLLTSLALLVMQRVSQPWLDKADGLRLSSLTLIAFSVSLVVAGPLALVMSRKLADAIHARQVGHVTPMMLNTLGWTLGLLAAVGLVIFGLMPRLSLALRGLGFALLMVTGAVWVCAAIMNALRSYGAVVFAFALGLALSCGGAAWLAPKAGLVGVLAAFVVGQATVFFVLAARVMAEFPTRGAASPGFSLGRALQRHEPLALAGLFYCTGLWVDKWLMWQAPGAETSGDGLWAHPRYEMAMFMAMLTMVPVMVLLLIDIETRFHATYQRFYRDISGDATLRGIRRNHGALLRFATESFQRLVLIQVVVAVVVIIATPALTAWAGVGDDMASIFRFGVVGAAFHVLLLTVMAALAYFDQPRWMLASAITYFVLNAVLTWIISRMDVAFLGWGYTLAALVAFAMAYYGAASTLARLPYMTFVKNNSAVTA